MIAVVGSQSTGSTSTIQAKVLSSKASLESNCFPPERESLLAAQLKFNCTKLQVTKSLLNLSNEKVNITKIWISSVKQSRHRLTKLVEETKG